jgi:hypothetical protein
MFADEINSQINAGRETIQRSLEDAQKQVSIDRVPRAAMYATGFAVFALAVGVGGWMIYRRSRRRTLVQRLQEALPDSVREMPDGLRAKARARIRTL